MNHTTNNTLDSMHTQSFADRETEMQPNQTHNKEVS